MTDAKQHRKAPILQRSSRDWIAVVVITVVCVGVVAAAVITAPIRRSVLSPAVSSYSAPVPVNLAATAYHQQWEAPADSVTARPVVAEGLVISTAADEQTSTIRALDPTTGDTVWQYSRDVPLCSLSQAWSSVVATYHTGVGCGDVVRIDALTGNYKSTRSALSDDVVVPISSNDRVGVVSDQRVELWRSDLVRTVEYGNVEAKQEPNLQPHEDCTISSALTRTENLAVVETCDGTEWLRLEKATPEEARKPEITEDILLFGSGNQVVAINQDGAAVYSPDSGPAIISYDATGTIVSHRRVAPSPWITNDPTEVFAAHTADLPHHMSWFDGDRLYLFLPSSLAVTQVFDDAIGTGVVLGNSIVYPTDTGLNVSNWDTGVVEREIPVDRGDYRGEVSLAVAGDTIIEKRGTTLVGLRP